MDCVNWIALIAVLSAVAAAIAAWRSASATEKSAKAQILLHITSSYASSEMGEAVKTLHFFKKNHNDFAEKFSKSLKARDKWAVDHDVDRRRIVHYFHQIYALVNGEVIYDSLVKVFIKLDQVKTLLYVIEPMDKTINPNYDTSTFNYFRNLYKREHTSDKLNA